MFLISLNSVTHPVLPPEPYWGRERTAVITEVITIMVAMMLFIFVSNGWLKVSESVSPLVLYLSRQSCAHLKLVPLNKRVSRSAWSTLENQLWGIQRLVRMEFHCNKFVLGPWRRHRCLRGRFRYHRTPVRIQSLETLIKQLFAVNCFKITTLYFLLMKKFKGHLSLDKSATGAWKQSDLTHIWAIFKWP